MKKMLFSLILLLLTLGAFLILFTACGHEHEWKDATCIAPKTCSTCEATEGAALGHTEAVDAAKAPTCTETGLTEGKHCSVCNEVLVAQETVAATGHTWVNATCTMPKTCSVCNVTEGEMLAHEIDTKTSKCKHCGAFEYNIEYAVRGFLQKVFIEFANSAYDSYEILNVYYVLDDTCACYGCKEGLDVGEPYITMVIFYRYTVDYTTDVSAEVVPIHKYYNEAEDTHYQSSFYDSYYWFRYTGDELTEIYAEDYSFYYSVEDLIKIEKNKVL